MYLFPFLLSILRICVHLFLAPPEPFNDKEKGDFFGGGLLFFYSIFRG